MWYLRGSFYGFKKLHKTGDESTSQGNHSDSIKNLPLSENFRILLK